MKCNICEEELNVPDIICPVCGEKQNIVDNRIIDYLINQYQEYKNNCIQYNKEEYDDTYKTRAIKNTKLEVFRDVVNMLEFAIKEYGKIDTSKIEIEHRYVETPKMCQINRNKVCNHCMNC